MIIKLKKLVKGCKGPGPGKGDGHGRMKRGMFAMKNTSGIVPIPAPVSTNPAGN